MELPQHKQTFYINWYETKVLEGMVPSAHHLSLRDEALLVLHLLLHKQPIHAPPLDRRDMTVGK